MKSIQRDGTKLVSASAFYKNDKAGGVGIHYPQPSKNFIQTIDELLKVWDAHATPERIHAQLKEFGEYLKIHEDMPPQHTITAFVDIVWLESRGHLVPDNFNGGLWYWTSDRA